MKTKLQQVVAREHASLHSVGIIDETGCAKKGEKTPGVQLQWCGASGRKDNCIVTVHLAYAADDFHCLLDSELFLPESWSNDRPRCRAAHIPEDMVHRTKPQIAWELYDRSKGNGVVFEWLTFDELYGHNREFLTGLRHRQQKYVGEVPVTFTGWVQSPRVTHRNYRRCAYRGRVRKTPRCVQGTPHPQSVREHLQSSPELRDQPWQKFRIKDGEKGPQVWEAKHLWFYPQDGQGLPQEPAHLIVARNVFEPQQIKFFIAHAPRETPLTVLLYVAFTRWRVERCFEDQKTELGFDHFEGRSYVGLMRHQIITALTHLFLSRVHLQWREKKSPVDGVPGTNGFVSPGSILVADEDGRQPTLDASRPNHHPHPRPQGPRSTQPPQTNPAATPCSSDPSDRDFEMRVGKKLAL